jgi:Uma2 family endonuclease
LATEKKSLLTADELIRLPRGRGARHELIRGELRTMPPSGEEHGIVAGEVYTLVKVFVRAHSLGYVLAAETGFFIAHNPDTVRAPDMAFISARRFPMSGPSAKYSEIPPDLLAEVVSPSDNESDVVEKVQQWLAFGVRLVWAVYPRTRSVVAYRSMLDPPRLTSDEDLTCEDILPGCSCKVSDFFPY